MKIFLLFLILVNAPVTYAQESNAKKDYVVKFGGLTPSLEFDARAINENSREIQYKPSTEAKTFLGLSHKNYGVSLSAYNPRTSEFRQKHGNGRNIDFQFRYSYEDYYLESYYQQYKGYYISNPSKLLVTPYGPQGQYPQNGSLKTEHYGVQILKFLDIQNFHPRRAFELIDRPQKSGGTWYYSASLNTHRLRSPTSLVPAAATSPYAGLEDLRDAKAYTLAGGFGGAYSLVIRESWVASGLLGLSIGPQWIDSSYTTEKKTRNMFIAKTQFKLTVGYSGEEFLSAVTLESDSTQLKDHTSELNFRSQETAFFIGWRF